MSRRYEDYYEDRRERDYVSRSHGRYDDRYYDEEIEFRRSRPAPVREREREEVRVEEVVRGPAYVREEFDRVPGGQVILRSREREEFDYAPPPPRRRSPSPERRVERETITIRRDRSQSRPPMPPPPPPEEKVREEIIIKRSDNEERRSQVEFDDTRSRKSYAPPRSSGEIKKEEIIIRKEESDRSAPPSRASARPKSRERERSRHGSGSESENEIIIRRDEREGRRGERQSEEIIIRRRSRSSSSSRSRPASVAPSVRTAPPPPPPPQIINAPQIHQEVITHHRHIDHGFEIAAPPRRIISRPPSPPSPPRSLTPSPPPPPPPPARERSEERIEIHRSGEKDGRSYHDDIVIDRNEGARSTPPRELHTPEPRRGPPSARDWRDERDIEEEAAYYNKIAVRRGHPGEAYHGATRDWELVDVPPGTKRVHMDGAGGGAQEISWQRYNGMRRSRFYPDDDEDDAYSRYEAERSRPLPPPAPLPAPAREQRGDIGGRFGRARNPKDGLWTEITKDLVVKEAIKEMGYEYEETDEFYYIIAYLKYDDVARLVGLSEDIRKDRRKRVKEIEWESRVKAEESPRSSRLAIEPPSAVRDKSSFDREEDRYIEREIVYRGGRPPPPVGWRR